jgi:hypothetical protein
MSILQPSDISAYLGPTATNTALIAILQGQVERLIKNYVGYEVEQNTWTEYQPFYRSTFPIDPLVEGYEMWAGKAVPVQRFADDRRVVQLNQLPVRSIISIYENPMAWASGVPPQYPPDSFLDPTNWQPDFESFDTGTLLGISWTGFVYRVSGIWQNVERSIQVTYTAGFTQGELSTTYSDFKLAALVAMQTWYNQVMANQLNPVTGAVGGAVVSEGLDGWSISYDASSAARNSGYLHTLPQTSLRILEDRVRYSKFMS